MILPTINGWNIQSEKTLLNNNVKITATYISTFNCNEFIKNVDNLLTHVEKLICIQYITIGKMKFQRSPSLREGDRRRIQKLKSNEKFNSATVIEKLKKCQLIEFEKYVIIFGKEYMKEEEIPIMQRDDFDWENYYEETDHADLVEYLMEH